MRLGKDLPNARGVTIRLGVGLVTCFMDWNIEFLLSLAMFESFTLSNALRTVELLYSTSIVKPKEPS